MKHLPIAFVLSATALSLPAAANTAYNSISVPGDIFAAGWNVEANHLTKSGSDDWSGSLTPAYSFGKFKFAANDSWNVNWGGEFSILRVPAYGVGPLTIKRPDNNPADLFWTNAAVGTPHTFVFHADTATFDITNAATHTFTSLQLVGNFNHLGADPAGVLTKSQSGLWTGEIEVPGGSDSFLLRVDNQASWGLAAPRAAALPVDNASLCGSNSLAVSGIKNGTLAVTFDPAKLLLSVRQATTNAFVYQYIAADVSFAVGDPCDVNLEETDDGHWVADFIVTNATDVPFYLSFSQRDAHGNQGGLYWVATNSSTTTRTYPISETLAAVDTPPANDTRKIKCQGGSGRYRISFARATGELSVRRLYYLSGRVNLLPNPSLESCKEDEEGIPDGGVSVWNARVVDAAVVTNLDFGAHSGSHAAFFPQAGGGQDDPDKFYGSLSYDVPVTNAAGASLSVSAYLRAYRSWEGGTAQIQISWIGADGSAVGEHRYDLLNPDPVAWKAYSTEAPVPDNARSAHVVWLYSSAPETGGLLLDDLEIRLASSRSQNFDAWTSILDKWAAFSPDWAVAPYGKTVDNSKDLALPPGGVLISKYIEGTGNNKAIEIFNGTNAPVDLSQYELVQYDNGATTPTTVISLPSTNLAPGACFVVTRPIHNANYPPDPSLLAAASASGMTSKLLTFNGDDVVVLRKGTTVVDRIGQVSANATNAFWAYVCKNRTLVRKSTVHKGLATAVTAPFSFDEWELLSCDDFSGLGSHSRSLGDDVFVPSGLSLVLYDDASLVSPMLDGGIGDLSFWYRAATSTNAAAATLRVEASADESFSAPVVLTNITVSPSLVSFTNFALFVNRSDLSFVRFSETTGAGSSHVRLDDISVTPAVAASRYQDFNAWTNSSWAERDGTYSLASWTISNGRIAPTAGSSGTPAARLKPDASLTSPVFASGIGTVVFLAARDASAGSSDPAKITFQISSDAGATWTDAASISVTNTAWTSLTVPADIPSSASVKFLSSGDSPLLLDNIELRVYEGTARSQNFNSWPVNNSYSNRFGQGWIASSAAVDAGPSGNCLRMKDSGATITSPVFSGGLGTLSLDAKSYSSSHNPTFVAEASTDGGKTFPITLFTGSLTTSDLAFRSFSKTINNAAINCVRLRLTNSKIVHFDNINCGIIKPPPSVSVTPSVSPDPLDLETPFSFSASVQPSGDAVVDSVSIRWQTVVGKTTSAWTTNALDYSPATDIWTSPTFPNNFQEATRLQYQAFAVWSSLELGSTNTTYSDVYTNLASSVAGGGVWINEIFYRYYPGEADWFGGDQDHEYIELCGPANQSIGLWSVRLEFARQQEIALNSNIASYARILLPPGAALTNHITDDGCYGFYLVGDINNADWGSEVDLSLGTKYVPQNVGAPDTGNDNIHDFSGVIRLFNDTGSQIDAVSYGRKVGGLVFTGQVGPYDEGYSLSASGTNGYIAASFSTNWNASTNISPGSANPCQTFSNRPSSTLELPVDARHDPINPVKLTSGENFFMRNPTNPAIFDRIMFAMAFSTNYGEPAGILHVESSVKGSSTYPLALQGMAESTNKESFLQHTFGEYTTFSRFETIRYYFEFKPAGWLTGFLASDGAGGSCVYSNDTAAASNAFVYTFPFHDQFVFTEFSPTSPEPLWQMTVVDENEYTKILGWNDLRLEINTNSLTASNAWEIWLFDPDGEPIPDGSEKITTYRLKLALPKTSPAFFRLAPKPPEQ